MENKLYRHLAGSIICLVLTAACTNSPKNMNEPETKVLIETSAGDIKVKLYNDTPLHRDNFLKTVREGAYDNILFHRIVRNFMVQSGDPTLKPGNIQPTVDTTAYRYTIPAEIVYPRHFHHKGALAAARMGDAVNPRKESSGTQFYIVTGKVFSKIELMELRNALYQSKVDALYEQMRSGHLKELYLLRKSGKMERLHELEDSLLREAESYMVQNPPAPLTPEQERAYTTIGGAPHLDGEYTVFGEVVEGIHVAETIEKVRSDGKERPVSEVYIKKMTVIED